MSLIGLLTATEKQVHLGRLHMRPIQWHLKNKWQVPESLEKAIPVPRSLHPHLQWWLEDTTCAADFYRCIKRRVGCSLKRAHGQSGLVTVRKQAAHKLSGTKSSLLSSERVPRPLYQQNSTCCNRQHYSSVIHNQGRRHEVGPAVCPSMENLDLVYLETSDSQSQTHSTYLETSDSQSQTHSKHIPDKLSRLGQTIQTEWSPGGFPSNMQQVAQASHRLICHKVQQQVTPVCVTST